jgi:hypothetical protein
MDRCYIIYSLKTGRYFESEESLLRFMVWECTFMPEGEPIKCVGAGFETEWTKGERI